MLGAKIVKEKYSRVKITAYFWGVLLVFILPFATVVYQLIREIDVGIQFARKEQLGVEYSEPLRNLLEHVIAHRSLTDSYLKGNETAKKKLAIKQSQIEKDIARIDESDRRLGSVLKTSQKWQSLKEKLQPLKNQVFNLSPQQSFQLHSAVIAEILDAIALVGDTSNLILDPDLDSYYLMDAAVNHLPYMMEKTAQLQELGLEIIEKRSLATSEKINLIILASALDSHQNRIQRGMQVAFQQNPPLALKLDPYVQDKIYATRGLVEAVNKNLLEADNFELKAVDYFAASSEALESQLRLYDRVLPDLQELLQIRIDGFSRKKYFVQVFALLVAGVSLYVFVASARNFNKRLQAEKAMQEAEAKYRSIFENSTDGIFQTTPEGRYISANPALASIYGYASPEELIANIGNIERQLYVDFNRRAEFVRLMEEHDAVANFESQVYRKDGKAIWISENARAVKDKNGKLLYYEGSVEDITVRKVTEEALLQQKEQTDRLLLNILPEAIAHRLKTENSSIADTFEDVTVLFADIVGFTQLSTRMSPQDLVNLLNEIFSAFDQLAERHGLEKIKTIGDAYMVVGGLPVPRKDHAEAIAEMALDMQKEIARFSALNAEELNIRIGINSGSVVAGVIGIKKFIYDLWGDTVNIASRMESHGIPGCTQVTAATYALLRDKYIFEERGTIEVKGRGEMNVYLLVGRKI